MAERRLLLRLRRFCAKFAKAAIQTDTDRSPHAALRTKVGFAKEAVFAKTSGCFRCPIYDMLGLKTNGRRITIVSGGFRCQKKQSTNFLV